jgi:hypothetical protein
MYTTLFDRVVNTLTEAFLRPDTFAAHYGAIIGLQMLGPHVVSEVLMTNIHKYVSIISPKLWEKKFSIEQLEAWRCYDALLVFQFRNLPNLIACIWQILSKDGC